MQTLINGVVRTKQTHKHPTREANELLRQNRPRVPRAMYHIAHKIEDLRGANKGERQLATSQLEMPTDLLAACPISRQLPAAIALFPPGNNGA